MRNICPVEGDSAFEQVVRPLEVDPAWRRRVRRVMVGNLLRRGGRMLATGFSQIGWCYTTCPPAAVSTYPSAVQAGTESKRK